MKVLGAQVQPTAQNARNFSQCDSMLIGDTAGANTYPYIQVGLARRSASMQQTLHASVQMLAVS